MNKKKLMTMIICSIMVLNIGAVTVFADPTVGGAESLKGHGPSDISRTGDSGTKVTPGNGEAVVEMRGTSLPQSSSKTPKNSSSQKNTNKNPSKNKKTDKNPSKSEKTDPGTPRANRGSDTSKEQIVTPPEWHITEGWVWSLSEWGKRSDWWKGKNADKDPWSKVGLSNKDIRIK